MRTTTKFTCGCYGEQCWRPARFARGTQEKFVCSTVLWAVIFAVVAEDNPLAHGTAGPLENMEKTGACGNSCTAVHTYNSIQPNEVGVA